LLNARFVNTWILRRDLMALAKSEPANAFAQTLLKQYAYPVDSLLFDEHGAFASHLPADQLLTDSDMGNRKYLGFLERALPKKAGAESK
jgi:hypothetical protein